MIDSTSSARRSHPGRRAAPITLTAEERAIFEAACRPAKAERRIVLRAQAVLLMADGVPGVDIAKVLEHRVPAAPTVQRAEPCGST